MEIFSSKYYLPHTILWSVPRAFFSRGRFWGPEYERGCFKRNWTCIIFSESTIRIQINSFTVLYAYHYYCIIFSVFVVPKLHFLVCESTHQWNFFKNNLAIYQFNYSTFLLIFFFFFFFSMLKCIVRYFTFSTN